MKPTSFLLLLFFQIIWCPAALAQDTVTRDVRLGQRVQLDAAPCIEIIAKPAMGRPLVEKGVGGGDVLWYEPDEKQQDPVVIHIKVGSMPSADGKVCAADAPRKIYQLSIERQPQTSALTADTAFRLLMTAFVLALLLESAFELLFNWRLFQEFFVGKAWRTPIMFGVSLLLITTFKIDLLASLFDAYAGPRTGSPATESTLLTKILTAMIISGGSVGVNRILVNLGFRAPITKKEAEVQQLRTNEAYISVLIRSKQSVPLFEVTVTETSEDVTVPTTVAILRAPGPGRIREIMFPSSLRVPRSGGHTIRTDKCYRISVKDLRSDRRYDTSGNQLVLGTEPPLLRFAPRAIVDFIVVPCDENVAPS